MGKLYKLFPPSHWRRGGLLHNLHESSTFEFNELSVVKEGSQWIIGRPETGVYIRTDEVGKGIIDVLIQGTLADAERRFPSYNVRRFVSELQHDGFLRGIDDYRVPDPHRGMFTSLFNSVRPEQVGWLFSPPLLMLYLAIIGVGAFVFVRAPELLPVPSDFFFTEYLMLLLPVSFLTGVVLLMLHEAGHFLAAKSHGLLTRFGITNRYYYIVAITDVTNVYSLPRNKRFRILYGGMVVDALVMSLCAISLYFFHPPPWLEAYLSFVILIEFLGLWWQLYLFLRTDLYYVLENILGVHNLNAKTRQFLRRPRSTHFATQREKRITQVYAPFFVLGYVLLSLQVVFFGIPIMTEAIRRVFTQLFLSKELFEFIDATVFMLFMLLNPVILGVVVIARHFRRPVAKLFALTFLLMGEFLLVFLLLASTLLATTSFALTGGVSFLLGCAFCAPLAYLWYKARPSQSLQKEFLAILVVIFLVYSYVLKVLLGRFLHQAGRSVPVGSVIVAFVLGVLAAASFAWSELRSTSR